VSELGYLVVCNEEEQYSILEQGSALPPGWRAEGFAGTRDECLTHIETVWTDMRPRSVRLAAARAAELADS
jgi:MbtH protein